MLFVIKYNIIYYSSGTIVHRNAIFKEHKSIIQKYLFFVIEQRTLHSVWLMHDTYTDRNVVNIRGRLTNHPLDCIDMYKNSIHKGGFPPDHDLATLLILCVHSDLILEK